MLSNFDESVDKEWIITNGLGGYASSTILNLNTRKYHGLLVAALDPPRNRTVCLESLDDEIIANDSLYQLSSHEFHGSISPKGHLFLNEVSLSPFPTFTYQIPNITLKKTFFMPYKTNSVATIYNIQNSGSNEAKLRVTPLITCRHYDAVTNYSEAPLTFTQEHKFQKLKLTFESPKKAVVELTFFGQFCRRT